MVKINKLSEYQYFNFVKGIYGKQRKPCEICEFIPLTSRMCNSK